MVGVGACAWRFDGAVSDAGDGAGLRVNGAGPTEVVFTPGEDVVYALYDPPPAVGDAWALDPAAGGAPLTFADGRPPLAASGECAEG